MSRLSNREKILTEGMRVVLQHGFGGASVRDIVHAAGVPQGSFSNHFITKEAFGQELLNIYFENIQLVIRETLDNETLLPLMALRQFIGANKRRLEQDGVKNGCLSGNFGAQAVDHSEPIRVQLMEIFKEIRDAIANCLGRAVQQGSMRSDIACEELAGAILGGLQGAILLSKVQRDSTPIVQFEYALFSLVLGHPHLLTQSAA